MSEVKRKIKARRKTRNGGDGKESSESSERENPLRVVQCAKAKWLPVDLLSEYCIRKGGRELPNSADSLCPILGYKRFFISAAVQSVAPRESLLAAVGLRYVLSTKKFAFLVLDFYFQGIRISLDRSKQTYVQKIVEVFISWRFI